MAQELTIVLAGNPNSGKTTLFNALTGARQHVGNYPGVTVEKKMGTALLDGRSITIVDLPGTYSLTAYSLEELVARNYLLGERPDAVVHVVDASNLERNLYLTVQLRELGLPLVIALNMMDVAEARGIKVDHRKLSQLLGVPVIPTVARVGKGGEDLLAAAAEVGDRGGQWQPLVISYGSDLDQGLAQLTEILTGGTPRQGLVSAHWLAVKLLEGDSEVMDSLGRDTELARKVQPLRQRLAEHLRATLDDDPESLIADYRYGYIAAVTREAVTQERQVRLDFSDRVDRVLTHRLGGPLLLLGVLYAVYQFVFWASQGPVAGLEATFTWLGGAMEGWLPEGLLRSLVVSGIINGVGGVLGFVPLIMFMFFAIAVLEDSGYMARMAYLLDRILRAFGLHGNSVISLIVGGGISGGCAVPGIMATRTLKDPQARLATILVVPFMNCGAKLPVYSLLIAAFFASRQAEVMMALTLVSWVLALSAAWLLRTTVLRGEQSPFVMELPPYRAPVLKGLLIHTWERTWEYISRAGTLLLAVSVVMWALMSFPGLSEEQEAAFQARIEQAGEDQEAVRAVKAEQSQATLAATVAGSLGRAMTTLTAPLDLDWQTNVALVGGLAAKEVIVSTLGTAYSLGEPEGKGKGGAEADPTPLSDKLKESENWTPLKALALMIFVMIYSPCVATLIMIRRETHTWRWPAFSVVYNTVVAYALALAVYQGGLALGLG